MAGHNPYIVLSKLEPEQGRLVGMRDRANAATSGASAVPSGCYEPMSFCTEHSFRGLERTMAAGIADRTKGWNNKVPPVVYTSKEDQLPYSPILLVHICAGTLGLVSGTAALSFRKGSRRHVLAGKVFVASMSSRALPMAPRSAAMLSVLATTSEDTIAYSSHGG